MVGIEPKAAAILTGYDWPGNVRELENVIERAVVLAETNQITSKELQGVTNFGGSPESDHPVKLADVEKQHIKKCLDSNSWNLGETADQLGIHRNTLRLKIKEYELTQD